MIEILDKIDKLHARINQMRPLESETLASLRNYYKIGLTWSSNALEGNTLTESETKVVIEDGLTIGGKPLKDHFEASGHADAFDEVIRLSQKDEITEIDILKLHRLFFLKIDEKNAGAYRTKPVFISGSHYPLPLPEKVPALMKEFTNLVSSFRKTEHPVVTAAKAHLKFVFIHPFVDGNGRVARLLMNLVLLQQGYQIAIIPPVLRGEYIASIEAARKDETDFIKLICRSVYETQKDYLRMLNG